MRKNIFYVNEKITNGSDWKGRNRETELLQNVYIPITSVSGKFD